MTICRFYRCKCDVMEYLVLGTIHKTQAEGKEKKNQYMFHSTDLLRSASSCAKSFLCKAGMQMMRLLRIPISHAQWTHDNSLIVTTFWQRDSLLSWLQALRHSNDILFPLTFLVLMYTNKLQLKTMWSYTPPSAIPPLLLLNLKKIKNKLKIVPRDRCHFNANEEQKKEAPHSNK